MKKVFVFLKTLILSLSFITLFVSCDLFTADMNKFFIKYTETAAIEQIEFDGNFQKNKNGIICLPSETDHTITFYLRNPLNDELVFKYFIEDTELNISGVTLFEQSEDRISVKLSLPSNFTSQRDKDLALKDISGHITLKQKLTPFREFNPYYFNLNIDSPPPSIEKPCIQLSSAQNGNYILCFFLPDVSKYEVHKDDTSKIYFNNTLYYFKNGKLFTDKDFTIEDTRFSTTVPASMVAATEGGFTFDKTKCPSNYIPVYFSTGITQASKPEISYSIKIEDDAGLVSDTKYISNKSKQLNTPEIQNISALKTGVPVNEETETYEVIISHDGLCTDGESSGTVNIEYTVFDKLNSNKVYKKGTAPSPVKLNLPKGKYDIKAKALKPYFIESDEYDSSVPAVTGIYIKGNSIYYVKADGNDVTGDGRKANPFATVKQAIQKFNADITANLCDANDVCTIRVLSDLTNTEADSKDGSDHPFISFPTGKNFVLEGSGGQWILDAKGENSNIVTENHRVISSESSLTIKNLKLKGGYLSAASLFGAGIYCKEDLTVENCFISENKILNSSSSEIKGSGIYAAKSLTLNNTTISNNSIWTTQKCIMGVGVYSNETTKINNSSITNNISYFSDTVNVKGCGIYSATGYEISGKTTIYDNKAQKNTEVILSQSNIYLPASKFITASGNISGSKIGFTTEKEIDNETTTQITVVKNYNYQTVNKTHPSGIFKSDVSYAVDWDNGTSTIIAKASGGGVEFNTKKTYSVSSDKSGTVSKGTYITFTAGGEGILPTSTITYSYIVTMHGDIVPQNSSTYITNSNKLQFASSIISGTYSVFVTVSDANGNGGQEFTFNVQ